MKTLLINLAFGIPALVGVVLLIRGLHAFFGENLGPALLGISLLVACSFLLGGFIRLVIKDNNLFTDSRVLKAINRWEKK